MEITIQNEKLAAADIIIIAHNVTTSCGDIEYDFKGQIRFQPDGFLDDEEGIGLMVELTEEQCDEIVAYYGLWWEIEREIVNEFEAMKEDKKILDHELWGEK